MPLTKAAVIHVIQEGCLLSSLSAVSRHGIVFLGPEMGPFVSSIITLFKHAIQSIVSKAHVLV